VTTPRHLPQQHAPIGGVTLLGVYLRGTFMSGAHWQTPCRLSRRRVFIARLHHSGPPNSN
jgi:hypothetical protein